MTKDKCFYVGKIVKTHGLKGEVTLRIDNEQFDDIEELNYFLLDINEKLIPFFIPRSEDFGSCIATCRNCSVSSSGLASRKRRQRFLFS